VRTARSGPRERTGAVLGSIVHDEVGGIAVVRINRRSAGNAIDRGTAESLAATWARIGHQGDVHTVVLSGTGPEAFSVGFDRLDQPTGPAAVLDPRAHGLQQRLVVGVNGIVCREAWAFLRVADAVVASANASFVPVGETARGRPVSAAEAAATGLVADVVPLHQLQAAVLHLSGRLAGA
jgi:enoyl-CoA hydratase/carnithine racemase